jgi:hypothetical protein
MAKRILNRAPTTERLRAALDDGFGTAVAVGLITVPLVSGATPTGPYGILMPLWTELSGPEYGSDRQADAKWTYQLNLYGQRGDQMEALRDRALEVVLGKAAVGTAFETSLDVAGCKITGRELVDDNGVGDAVNGLLPSELRFALWATPDT